MRADLHRDGLSFPPFLYGRKVHPVPPGISFITVARESLALVAREVGHRY